jgi:hypothetical protein
VTATGPEPEEASTGVGQPAPIGGSDAIGDSFPNLGWVAVTGATELENWRQGDLVSGMRTMWAVPSHGSDPVADVVLEAHPDGGWVAARAEAPETDDGTVLDELGIIISQTCDVVGTGPGARHPTVQVCPVVRLDNIPASRAADVRTGRTVDMMVLTGLDPIGDWAVDLRLSVPLSKATLVEQEPLRGFQDEAKALEFSDRVAIKFRRPALHDYVTIDMTESLNKLIRSQRGAKAIWMDRIEQVRVRAVEGDRLNPQALEVIVVTLDEPFTAAERDPIRKWRESHKRGFLHATNGGKLLPVRFRDLDKLGAKDYREAVPLNLPELQQRPFW